MVRLRAAPAHPEVSLLARSPARLATPTARGGSRTWNFEDYFASM